MTTVLTPIVPAGEAPAGKGASIGRKLWAWSWPKLLAVVLVLAFWQIVVWTGWRPEYVLPGPAETLQTLGDLITTAHF